MYGKRWILFFSRFIVFREITALLIYVASNWIIDSLEIYIWMLLACTLANNTVFQITWKNMGDGFHWVIVAVLCKTRSSCFVKKERHQDRHIRSSMFTGFQWWPNRQIVVQVWIICFKKGAGFSSENLALFGTVASACTYHPFYYFFRMNLLLNNPDIQPRCYKKLQTAQP